MNVNMIDIQKQVCGNDLSKFNESSAACGSNIVHDFFNTPPLGSSVANFTTLKVQPTVSNHTNITSQNF
jgi:hypothetical protein